MLEYFKDQIKDELNGAMSYIRLAMETKVSHPEWSSMFVEMSLMEVDHATNLYKMFTDETGPLMESYSETPEYISKIVKEVISFYSKHYAEVMYMHDAYKK